MASSSGVVKDVGTSAILAGWKRSGWDLSVDKLVKIH
jgi:hypothetical protein